MKGCIRVLPVFSEGRPAAFTTAALRSSKPAPDAADVDITSLHAPLTCHDSAPHHSLVTSSYTDPPAFTCEFMQSLGLPQMAPLYRCRDIMGSHAWEKDTGQMASPRQAGSVARMLRRLQYPLCWPPE